MVQEGQEEPQDCPDPALEVRQCPSYSIVSVSRVTKASQIPEKEKKTPCLMGSSKSHYRRACEIRIHSCGQHLWKMQYATCLSQHITISSFIFIKPCFTLPNPEDKFICILQKLCTYMQISKALLVVGGFKCTV